MAEQRRCAQNLLMWVEMQVAACNQQLLEYAQGIQQSMCLSSEARAAARAKLVGKLLPSCMWHAFCNTSLMSPLLPFLLFCLQYRNSCSVRMHSTPIRMHTRDWSS